MQNKGVFRIGTTLAERHIMKQSISMKHMMLLAGILVAIVIMFMIFSATEGYSAVNEEIHLPAFQLPDLAKAAIEKVVYSISLLR